VGQITRILFVAMHNSVHTCRWINQLAGQGWDLHLFPSWDGDTHPDLKECTVHELLYSRPPGLPSSVRIKGIYWPFSMASRMAIERMSRFLPLVQRVNRLVRLIQSLKPDIIESKEIQHAGYLTLEAKKYLKDKFPTWIVNNWGNDIYLFGRLAEHKEKIAEVLSSCDYYSCECQRDVQLARLAGFRGEILPVFPNTGGFNLSRIAQFRQPGPTSARRLIFLKGYQDWHGRALVGLRAIALCADLLRSKGYRVVIHSGLNTPVQIAAEVLSQDIGIPIEVLPRCSPDDILRFHGQARVHLGLAISDGIAITSIEAIAMGTFPIQSCTACADEWIINGENGFIVPPEDPEAVATALRRAISDDELVDHAAELNAKLASERLDENIIRPQVIEMYRNIMAKYTL
jgi:glycosyltransferase involved in cell wall biosynthesis